MNVYPKGMVFIRFTLLGTLLGLCAMFLSVMTAVFVDKSITEMNVLSRLDFWALLSVAVVLMYLFLAAVSVYFRCVKNKTDLIRMGIIALIVPSFVMGSILILSHLLFILLSFLITYLVGSLVYPNTD